MVLCLSNMQMRSATNLIKTYYAFFKYVFEDNWIYNEIHLKGSDIHLKSMLKENENYSNDNELNEI